MKNNKNETKHKLLNTLRDGKERTFEDIIRLLVDENKRKLQWMTTLMDIIWACSNTKVKAIAAK